MVELSQRDLSLILDIVIAARDAKSFVDGFAEADFLASRLHQNAVIRSLEVIGEAANTLSPECRDALPDSTHLDGVAGIGCSIACPPPPMLFVLCAIPNGFEFTNIAWRLGLITKYKS